MNQIRHTGGAVQQIDWGGAGVGPRLYPLAQLLDQCATTTGYDRGRLDAAIAAYSRHLSLSPGEVSRLGAASNIRIFWLAAWNAWTRVVRGKPLRGDEWWLARAVSRSGESAREITEAFTSR